MFLFLLWTVPNMSIKFRLSYSFICQGTSTKRQRSDL